MYRRRPSIVWLCLFALVWCQTAMAAQLCHGDMVMPANSSTAPCHGDGASADTSADQTTCPISKVVPDLGKLPTILPLLFGHDYVAGDGARAAVSTASAIVDAFPRDGPELATLCRLLI